jgi:hypothetical protein
VWHIAAAGTTVHIGQKIDQHSTATIKSANGSIDIGQRLSGDATARRVGARETSDANLGWHTYIDYPVSSPGRV